MKKIIRCFLIILTFFSFYTCVDALEGVNITNVKVVEKSGTITLDDLDFRNDTIKSKIIFNQINDFVTYEVELDNVGSVNYKLNSIDSNIDNEYLKLSSEDIGKNIKVGKNTVRFRIDYSKELINVESIKLDDTVVSFVFGPGDLDNNPNTGFDYNLLLLVLVFSVLCFVTVKKYRKKLLVLLLLIPTMVWAVDLLEVNLNISDITINGRMLSYKIAVENGNGEITYVDKYYGDNLLEDLPIPEKEGYTFSGWVDDNNNEISSDAKVEEDIKVIPKYEIVNYHIDYDLDGGVLEDNNKDSYNIEDEFTLSNPVKAGYTFAGWSDDDGLTLNTNLTIYRGTTGDKCYKAYYSVNQNTRYTVIHETMDLNGNYVEKEREVLEGATDTTVTPQVKYYDGFTSPEVQNLTITGDGNATLTYRYSRNRYQFSITNLDSVDTSRTTPNGEYYYDTDITVVAKEKAGYNIVWSDGSTEKERSFKLTKNTSLSVSYEARSDTQYKVIHKTMDLDGVNYSIKDEFIFTGTTDTTVTPAVNTYEGFTAPEVESLTITGDGGAELVYLYTRNKYDLVLEDSEYIESSFTSGSYYYGTEITLEAKEREDYKFVGWSNDETSNPITFTLKNDVTLQPIYDIKVTMFDTGVIVNRKMKTISGDESPTQYTDNTAVEKLVHSESLPSDFEVTEDNTISIIDSKYPIYIWYDSNSKELYYYTQDNEIYLNETPASMFKNMKGLVSIDDINSWNTSKATDMSGFFSSMAYNTSEFSIDLSNWDTSNVKNLSGIFYRMGYNAANWNIIGLANWDTSSVTNMYNTFGGAGFNANTINFDLTSWDVSNVTNMQKMFYDTGFRATNFSLNLSGWKTSKVTNVDEMFAFSGAVYNTAATNYYLNLSDWDTSNIKSFYRLFYSAGTTATNWSIEGLSNWDTSKVTNMWATFANAGSRASSINLDLSDWNTSRVTNMSGMFYWLGWKSTNWSIGDLSNWDTSNVSNMNQMFYNIGTESTVWNSIGTLKIYANNISSIFDGCNQAKVTINIYNNSSSYVRAFTGAATADGAQIKVNYSSAVTNIDDIIATKSETSNVIKGELLD